MFVRYRKTKNPGIFQILKKHIFHPNFQIAVELQHLLHTFEKDPAFDYFTVERVPVREVSLRRRASGLVVLEILQIKIYVQPPTKMISKNFFNAKSFK